MTAKTRDALVQGDDGRSAVSDFRLPARDWAVTQVPHRVAVVVALLEVLG